MGWNVGALFVKGLTAAEAVAALGPARPLGRVVEADEATSGSTGDVYATVAGGWAQAWTPSIDLLFEYEPGEESALTVLFGSVSSIYGFTYYEDGEFLRQVIYSDGEAEVDEGQPLPVEGTMTIAEWGPDEDFVWKVIESVTGSGWQPDLRFEGYRLK
jgi:hypothetical protein